MRRLGLMSALIVALGCRDRDAGVWLLLAVDPADKIELDAATVTPASAVLERRHEPRRLAVRLERAQRAVVVRAPGACPLTLTPAELGAGTTLERRLESLFDFGPSRRVVGFGQRFEVRAAPRCSEAERTRVELVPAGGAPLDELSSSEGGRVLAGRTRPLERPGGPAFGIVPVSAARRGVSSLRARVLLDDGSHVDRELEVSAGTRASGLPNVAVDHAVLLAGDTPKVVARPEGSTAELVARGGLFELVPDRPGAYGVADASGRTLNLNAGLYDETPLDCGRSDCHRAIAESDRTSPMTSALAADLGGRHPVADPECALLCHATGEPGRNDGGFTAVRAELGHGALPEKYAELPRALRRLGGVGCLACHGPGAIPEASARWAVLRSDVCAVCHDAPPRYGHVAALATTRMARADHDARQRDDAACARCHTTWGALARPERKPPVEAGAVGIGCAACHDVHPHGESAAPSVSAALLRATPIPSLLDAASAAVRGPSRVCLACHASEGDEPSASAAALWAGRGGIDPESGEALLGGAPHAAESRGCLGCHDAGPDSLSLGKGHAFRAPSTTCARCHDAAVARSPELAARARALFEKLAPLRAPGEPPHAALPSPRPLPAMRRRALRDILLVLEDPAADVHNRAYATLLLDRAERALGVPAERGAR